MSPYRTCRTCWTAFKPKGDWQKSCTPCWAKEKEAQIRRDAYNDGYRDGVRAAEAIGNHYHSHHPRPGALPAQLDPKLLRSIVELTHPDRHPPERFEQANRITAELLGMARAS